MCICAGLISCKSSPADQASEANSQSGIDTAVMKITSDAPAGGRYIDPLFDISVQKDIPYGKATDYLTRNKPYCWTYILQLETRKQTGLPSSGSTAADSHPAPRNPVLRASWPRHSQKRDTMSFHRLPPAQERQ